MQRLLAGAQHHQTLLLCLTPLLLPNLSLSQHMQPLLDMVVMAIYVIPIRRGPDPSQCMAMQRIEPGLLDASHQV